MSQSDFQIAIMAGGKSRRMGQNKALLRVGRIPIIERVISVARSFAPTVTPVIVSNTPQAYAHLGLPILADSVVDSGAIGGIHAVLTHAKKHSLQWSLVLACDMPFVSLALLRLMQEQCQRTEAKILVPQSAGYAQMLHAFYHTDVLPTVTRLIENEQFAVRALLNHVPVQTITEATLAQHAIPPHALMNCNTPDDLAEARRIADAFS